jgi:alanine dehydrogenase
MADAGGCKSLLRIDPGFRRGAYMFHGKLTNPLLGETFDLPYKDIELLIAAF